jgi:ribosomal protein S18 acetylase RimI-like enzyme
MGAALAIGGDLATATSVSRPNHPVPLDLAGEAIARSVLALQRESYAVEAALIRSDEIPQLTETLDGLRAAGLDWLGTFDEAGLAGAVSWKILADATVDIHRLVVAPRAFRRGIASALLDALDARFPGRPTLVSTGRDNGPARDLYRSRGFTLVREHEAVQGLWVAELERRGPRVRGA